MGIGVSGANYNYSTVNTSYTKTAAKENTETENTEETTTEQNPKTDTYKPDVDKIKAMKADLRKNVLAFKQMVYAMYKQQGSHADNALNALMQIDKETQLAAQEAISEDGYWGVNQTAQRTLDFAKALSGGDVSKIPELRDAIQKGFEAAEKVWGGKLPDICYETQQKVMDTLDEWEKNGKME